MSQQGDRRRHEDDWWGELYDPRRADAGPAAASDSVDDRFDSASRTLAGAEDADNQRPAAGAPWGPRTGEPGDAAPGSDADTGGGPQGWRSPADEEPGAASPFREGAGPGAARGGDAGSGAAPPSRGGGRSGDATQGGNAGSGAVPGRTGSGAAWGGGGSGAAWGGAGSGSAQGDEGPGAALPSQGGAGSGAAESRAGAGAPQGDAGSGGAPGRTGSGDGPGRAGPGKVPDRAGPGSAPGRSGPGGAPDRTGSGDAPGRSGPGSAPGRAGASVPPPPSPPSPPSPPPRGARASVPPRPDLHPDPSRPWRSAAASYVGDEPPTYEAEPTTLPVVDPEELRDLVPDTVLEGARYGTLTLRATSLRGDSARYRGEPRRDALLAVRFGIGDSALVLVAMASGQPAAPGAHRVARELCEWIAAAVGRNQARLTEDIHTANRGALSSGLHRLTGRAYGRLRAGATVRGLAPADHTASVRCLLLPAHPACRTRVFFGVGDGGLFRLRDGVWQDLEPAGGERDTVGGPVLGYGSGRPTAQQPPEQPQPPLPPQPPYTQADPSSAGPAAPSAPAPNPDPAHEPFRFRASVARPGDTLLVCSAGLAEPLRGEAALADRLAERWDTAEAPGLAAFLADAQTGVKGYADDRTAAAVWEA
ncbi:protein phosphatase 2C domain-containing protein [Streptomyces sp. 11-1-2]|uniref:protein phosphatase 2C domain-containing protein n=1 Tax=Streptomyces sp. 11-1-2 TaxID=1851167 RepID=UPI000B8DB504|nr:protein phosphatase 2C domain-containing protein [Streptomyces sp. 11-1-2]ASR00521.1 hypothetical protein CGL27_35210 [Streptomyces sp. 11-1-2]